MWSLIGRKLGSWGLRFRRGVMRRFSRCFVMGLGGSFLRWMGGFLRMNARRDRTCLVKSGV